jgi:hypothetical protein
MLGCCQMKLLHGAAKRNRMVYGKRKVARTRRAVTSKVAKVCSLPSTSQAPDNGSTQTWKD